MGARCGGSTVLRVASIKPWPLVPLKPKEETSDFGGEIFRRQREGDSTSWALPPQVFLPSWRQNKMKSNFQIFNVAWNLQGGL